MLFSADVVVTTEDSNNETQTMIITFTAIILVLGLSLGIAAIYMPRKGKISLQELKDYYSNIKAKKTSDSYKNINKVQ